MTFHRIHTLSLFLLLGIFPPGSLAFILSGSILEKGTKEPILGSGVYLEVVSNTTSAFRRNLTSPTPVPTPLSFSADANMKGVYSVSVPEGIYQAVAGADGYKSVTINFLALQGDQKSDFYLEKEEFTLSEVIVSTDNSHKTETSHEVLTKEELSKVAGTGGDVIRALQTLPGVTVADDYSGQLVVRGGGPEDNLFLLDRVPIAFPFHFGGLISTIDMDLVKSVDFSAGGFGPQYGNFWGGVIDVTQRPPRDDHWAGRTDVNLLMAEGEVEGPITSDCSLALEGRRSYLELFGGVFSNSFTAIPSFDDYEGKLSYKESDESRWDFEAFGSDDSLGVTVAPDTDTARHDPSLAGTFQYHNGYESQGINYGRLLDGQNTVLNTLYHYNFFFDTSLGQGYFINIQFEDFGDWFSWKHDFDEDTQLEGGLQYDHVLNGADGYFIDPPGEGDPNFDITGSLKIRSDITTMENNIGAYFNQKFKGLNKKLDVSIGMRMDYFTYNSTNSWGPRFSAAYSLSDDTIFRASYGYYHQLPIQGLYLDPNFGNPGLESETAISTILGVEQKLDRNLFLRVEGYNKDLSNVVVENAALHYSNDGTGYARGLEVFLRRAPSERFFGWISYAFSDSVRHNFPGDTHVYDFDQPNILTVLANYKLNPGWDVGVKFRYATGLPMTPITGRINDTVNNRYLPVYGPVNSARLPDYQRLDFSTSLTTVYNTWQWRVYLEILNVYNYQNIFAYDYNSNYSQIQPLYEFPFLPYVGFEIKY